MEAKTLVLGCGALAVLVHPNLNGRPLFDTIWTTSLYIDSVEVLPQLEMLSRGAGGVVRASAATN